MSGFLMARTGLRHCDSLCMHEFQLCRLSLTMSSYWLVWFRCAGGTLHAHQLCQSTQRLCRASHRVGKMVVPRKHHSPSLCIPADSLSHVLVRQHRSLPSRNGPNRDCTCTSPGNGLGICRVLLDRSKSYSLQTHTASIKVTWRVTFAILYALLSPPSVSHRFPQKGIFCKSPRSILYHYRLRAT